MSQKNLNFQAPPQLAITAGATSPDPGAIGAIIWSTTESSLLEWTGFNWLPLAYLLWPAGTQANQNADGAGYATTYRGTNPIAARADHVHPPATVNNAGLMTTAQVTALAGTAQLDTAGSAAGAAANGVPSSATKGTAAVAARGDHWHPQASASNDGLLSSADKSKLDGVASGATNTALSSAAPTAVGTAAAVGVGTTAARSDHAHAHGAQTDPTLHAVASQTANGFLSSADKTKLDGIASGATSTTLSGTPPANVGGIVSLTGTASTAARADHVHSHGTQTDGTLHAVATASVAGFMSAADKSKLDGLSTSATYLGEVPSTTVNPDAAGIDLVAEVLAGHREIAALGPNSEPTWFAQRALFSRRTHAYLAGGNPPTTWGATFSSTGTAGYSNGDPTLANPYQMGPYANFATTTTANSCASLYALAAVAARGAGGNAKGGGFFEYFRFSVPISIRCFVGLQNANATAFNPSASTALVPVNFTNAFGVSLDGSDTKYQMVCNGASATNAKVDTGITYTGSSDLVELFLYCPPGGSAFSWTIIVWPGSAAPVSASGSFTTNLPASNVGLYPMLGVQNVSGSAKSITVNRIYGESVH